MRFCASAVATTDASKVILRDLFMGALVPTSVAICGAGCGWQVIPFWVSEVGVSKRSRLGKRRLSRKVLLLGIFRDFTACR